MANDNEEIENIIVEICCDDALDFEWDTSDSSSTSSSDLDNTVKRIDQKTKLFVESAVVAYDEKEFKQHFRISRNIVYMLIDLASTKHVLPTHTFGRKKVTVEKGFLLTLWYVANSETFRQVANRFDVAKSTAHKIVKIMCDFLISIAQDYIKFNPRTRNNGLFGQIPGTVGCIDGTHIKINRPRRNQEVYVNRKGYHSIILQAVCDENKLFTDLCCGEPGSLNDARVLRRSRLYIHLYEGRKSLHNNFMLGDSAYPSLRWLVPPYKDNGHLTAEQRHFNRMHSQVRVIIENAFGLWKSRFRRLKFFENFDINFIKRCVLATCVLHNICILHDDLDIDINYVDDEMCADSNEYEEEEDIQYDRRQEIFNMLF